jgi:galactokinase
LPAAIEEDIILALRPTSNPTVTLYNVLPSFKPSAFPLTPPKEGSGEWHVDFVSPAEGGGWENYVKVATAECLETFFKAGSSQVAGRQPKGMELVVSGTVPPGSGLSVGQTHLVNSMRSG